MTDFKKLAQLRQLIEHIIAEKQPYTIGGCVIEHADELRSLVDGIEEDQKKVRNDTILEFKNDLIDSLSVLDGTSASANYCSGFREHASFMLQKLKTKETEPEPK